MKIFKLILAVSLQLAVIACLNGQSYSRFGMDTTGGNVPRGLELNSIAPDFKALNQDDKEIHLYDLLKSQRVVLFFYRGNWCPFCNTYLQNMQDSLDYLLASNTAVIAVSPENPDNVDKTVRKHQLGFHVVYDAENQIMEAYDVLFNVTGFYQTKIKVGRFIDLAENNNQDEARLPVPATYIIDMNKRIIYKHFNIDFRHRAPISEILRHLQEN